MDYKYFNKNKYNAVSLLDKLKEQAAVVCEGVEVTWCTFDHLYEKFTGALGTQHERWWADQLVENFTSMVWCRVYDTNGKKKEADQKATKAVVDFERRFK